MEVPGAVVAVRLAPHGNRIGERLWLRGCGADCQAVMERGTYGCRLCGGPLLEKREKWGIPGSYSADVNYGALSRGPNMGRPTSVSKHRHLVRRHDCAPTRMFL